MAVCTIQFFSEALGRDVQYIVMLPTAEVAGVGPYHVLLQLHGHGGSYTDWLYNTTLATYVPRLPLIIVLPSAENSFWTNWHSPRRYEDFLVQDLWKHVRATFPVNLNTPWAIGGLSVGGFGALRLGLKYRDKFSSVWAHSSFIPRLKDNMEQTEANAWWFNELARNPGADFDCYHWASQITGHKIPKLSFDCGTEDFLLEDNRHFHAYLQSISFPHTYKEHPGGHTWDYWSQHVQEALSQHIEVLTALAPS